MAKKIAKLHRLFFVRPKENTNADELAERFAGFENVDEVLLTEGDYGFIVKARMDSLEESKELARCISEVSSGSCGTVVSYYKYRK